MLVSSARSTNYDTNPEGKGDRLKDESARQIGWQTSEETEDMKKGRSFILEGGNVYYINNTT